MRLPVKFLPRQSQHLGNTVGSVLVILFGLSMMSSYLPDKPADGKVSFGEWIDAGGGQLPFLLMSSAVVLFGLAALTVALINLLGGSPFSYMSVDRFGIHSRTFFSERSFSWKELGPIRPLRVSPLRAMGLDRRFWIVSDTFSGETRIDARRPLSSFNLRIPVAAYLGSSWIGGNVEPAMDATAAWLESLRQLAQGDALDPDDVPEPPDALGPGLPMAKPAGEAAAAEPARTAADPDLPAMEDRKFGRRNGSTVER